MPLTSSFTSSVHSFYPILPFLYENYEIFQNSTNNNTNGTSSWLYSEWFGWIGVAVCILTWGTFTAPLKIKYVRDVNFDPMIYQFYFSAVVFLLSFLVLAWNEWYFSWYGVAGAAIWIPSSIFSIIAVDKLGLSVAQGLWSGVVILTNFIWGVTLFQSKIGNIYLTVLGLVLMVLGIVGVATCSKWNVETSSKKENFTQVDDDDLEKKDLLEDESLASLNPTRDNTPSQQETMPLFGKHQTSYDPAMKNDHHAQKEYGGVMNHLDHLIAQEEASLKGHVTLHSFGTQVSNANSTDTKCKV
ncbi:hypothetical protein C9374_008724 [Naegleria lovaniensis]|uniref:Uncharacterized protein n=1 Tax=Naegleria lovaniensis TaxID=51637 RepID=A0AA88KF81_NAELO|nr:uncharacterized protein C9374_008724 [Naegleria lovaniensis]KAG2378102.1 hypothetical protein C9374_008724 [Naegleria lovaniensis]